MSIRSVIKMGDPRLLLSAEPVTAFGTPQLTRLVEDLWEVMKARIKARYVPPENDLLAGILEEIEKG